MSMTQERLEGAALLAPEADAARAAGGTVRMSLDLSPQMKAVIDQLAADAGLPKSDILRQAIALLKVIKEAEQEGERPALIDAEGKVTARLVGI